LTSDGAMEAARDRAKLAGEFYIIIEPEPGNGRGTTIGPRSEEDVRMLLEQWEGLFTRVKLLCVVEDYEEQNAPLP
jgi:hypothetical protein